MTLGTTIKMEHSALTRLSIPAAVVKDAQHSVSLCWVSIIMVMVTHQLSCFRQLRWVCWTSKPGLSSVTKTVSLTIMTKAGAKHELLFYKLASELICCLWLCSVSQHLMGMFDPGHTLVVTRNQWLILFFQFLLFFFQFTKHSSFFSS
jgi:hypothetical protein